MISMKLGVKAHWTDADIMASISERCIEVVLHPEDVVGHQDRIVTAFGDIGESGTVILVHAQGYLPLEDGGGLLDLASLDPKVRARSVDLVDRTVALARELEAAHVVVHPGAVSKEKLDKRAIRDALGSSLQALSAPELLLENMPWFYWVFRGEGKGLLSRSNLCIFPEEFSEFFPDIGGMTLDLCHAYLATPKGGNEGIRRFSEELGDRIGHVHISDAGPPHSEGLQIGEGKVDFSCLTDLGAATGVVEIADGHLDGGERFRVALDRLGRYV